MQRYLSERIAWRPEVHPHKISQRGHQADDGVLRIRYCAHGMDVG